jgi:hypothetical protein
MAAARGVILDRREDVRPEVLFADAVLPGASAA